MNTTDEIKEIIKTVIKEASEYSNLVYINVNFNFEGSKSVVNLTGEPGEEPPPPPGGSGSGS